MRILRPVKSRRTLQIFAPLAACAIAALAALLAGPGSPRPGSTIRIREKPDLPDAEARQAWVEAGCWQCHRVSDIQDQLEAEFGAGAGGGRPTGPDLSGIGGLYSEGWHAAHFYDPVLVAPGSQMPAQRDLLDRDDPTRLNARGRQVVRFLQALRHPTPERAPWPTGRTAHPEQPGDPELGAGLYAEHCIGCHGEKADGSGPVAVFFDKKPADLAAGGFQWRTTSAPLPSPDDLFATLTNGLPGSGMPSFATSLSDHERASLVAWLLELNAEVYGELWGQLEARKLRFRRPEFSLELVRLGEAYFRNRERYGCTDCHGEDGYGDGPLAAEVREKYGYGPRNLRRDSLRRGDPDGLFSTIALGVGAAMSGSLARDGGNADELWALVAWVLAMRGESWDKPEPDK